MMRNVILTVIIIVGVYIAAAESRQQGLTGCPDRLLLERGLQQLSKSDWQSLTPASLQTIWPTKLDGLDCTNGTCQSVWSKDRIISGHCECCETFVFGNEDPASKDAVHLNNVIINYTVKSRSDAIATLKMFTKAMGVAQHDVDSIGRTAEQTFHLSAGRTERDIETRITQQRERWEIYLNIGAKH